MFVINDQKLMIIFPNYGPPLRLHEVRHFRDTVDKAVFDKRHVHVINDVFTEQDKICYIRANLDPTDPAGDRIAGLHVERKPDDKEEQPADSPKPQDGSTDAGQKRKIEIIREDSD